MNEVAIARSQDTRQEKPVQSRSQLFDAAVPQPGMVPADPDSFRRGEDVGQPLGVDTGGDPMLSAPLDLGALPEASGGDSGEQAKRGGPANAAQQVASGGPNESA